MPFDQWLTLHVPGLFLCLIIIALASLLSIGGVQIAHRLVSHHRLKGHNDITGPLFNTLGTIYAVLLAFVMVVIWQRYDRLQSNTATEIYHLADICVAAEPFEPSFRQEVRAQVEAYARATLAEWPLLARGEADPQARLALARLYKLYSGYAPRNATESVYFQESVDKVGKVMDLRMSRIVEGRMGIHPALWLVLIAGGMITIMFTVLFGSDSMRAKTLMSTLLAALIAMVLFTILDFSCPFSGTASLDAESFRQLLVHLGVIR